MKAWFVRGVGDMFLGSSPVEEPPPGWVTIRIRVVQPSVAEANAFQTGNWRHAERVAGLIAAHGPRRLFGHEFCGTVTAVGNGVTAIGVGDRATCIEPATPKGQVGLEIAGALAEYVTVPIESVVRVPADVSDSDAAAVQPMCYANSTVAAAGDLTDAVVAVFGQGSIGLPLNQLARIAGAAKVIAVARRPAGLAAARATGADEVLDSSSPDFADQLAKIAASGEVDVAFDAASGPVAAGFSGTTTLEWSFQIVRTGGRVAVAAALLREVIDFQVLQRKGLTMSLPHQHVSDVDGQRVLELVAAGQVSLGIAPTSFDGLESVPTAIEMAADKRRFGVALIPQVTVWSGDSASVA